MRALFLILTPLILAIACGGGNSHSPATPTPYPSPPPYSGVRFCVDVVDLPPEFRQFALDAVSEAAADSSDERPAAGCPPSRITTTKPEAGYDVIGLLVEARPDFWTAERGLFVYVVPDAWDLPPNHRHTSEEHACVGDVCYGLSDGLYLKQSELCDVALLTSALRAALSDGQDRPFTTNPTPYFDAPLPPGLTATPSPIPCY
jgi:hypothetical protein